MACRIATARTTRYPGAIGAALVSLALGLTPAAAQSPQAADSAPSPVSKACTPGSATLSDQSPLANVAAALAKSKT
ncbi:MAG: hypothetical protein ABI830_07730, partial [Pseudolabrys sp.]